MRLLSLVPESPLLVEAMKYRQETKPIAEICHISRKFGNHLSVEAVPLVSKPVQVILEICQ
jgi:hypothetical protein